LLLGVIGSLLAVTVARGRKRIEQVPKYVSGGEAQRSKRHDNGSGELHGGYEDFVRLIGSMSVVLEKAT
jgi:hypothetical protein